MEIDADLAASVRMFADREAIRDCLLHYCRAIDRCDAELLRKLYWPEAHDDHGIWSGSAAEYVDWVIPLVQERFKVTQHLLGNQLIELEGQQARVETYFQAFHEFREPVEAPSNVLLGGRYLDLLEKRQGQWRILRRRVVFDWFHDLGRASAWEEGPFGVPAYTGAFKPLDWVYRE
jgi:hypothetical protein